MHSILIEFCTQRDIGIKLNCHCHDLQATGLRCIKRYSVTSVLMQVFQWKYLFLPEYNGFIFFEIFLQGIFAQILFMEA